MLRVAISKRLAPAPHTILGWHVPDISATVENLLKAGVRLEHYGFKTHDELGDLDDARWSLRGVVRGSGREFVERYAVLKRPAATSQLETGRSNWRLVSEMDSSYGADRSGCY